VLGYGPARSKTTARIRSVRMSVRVSEWIARKADRAESPLAVARAAREQRKVGACGMGAGMTATAPAPRDAAITIAVCNGVEIARSARAELVSRRVWFPLEDCALESFKDSEKRWR